VLEALRIRDLGVIDDVEIALGSGLTVVTGETGAGKTMVVTSLQLLFGGRGDASRVRVGADQASVEGRLAIAAESAAAARAVDAGATIEDDELLLRRTVSAAGRSRAQVGGTTVPVGVLTAIGNDVFTVHGQSDQMRLGQPVEQRRALDRYAGIELATYAAAFQQWQAAEARLIERRSDTAALQREADLLSYGLAEIDAAAPLPGEDLELAALTVRLTAADELRRAARTAHDALLGDPDNPVSDAADVQTLLGIAHRELAAVSDSDVELAELARRLTDVQVQAAEIGADLAAYGETIDLDPARLEAAQERRARLAALTRKYAEPRMDGERPGVDDVLNWAASARARLAELDTSQDAIAALVARRDELQAAVAREAARIRKQRVASAAQLAQAVSGELAGLAMGDARFHISVRPRPALSGSPALSVAGENQPSGAGSDGTEEVEFLLQPRPDSPSIPIQKGASGGELSRVMLALEVVLAGTDPVPVMVFDEVDAGVGGRAAIEVGRRLSRLADGHQVIVVTHLAQVAAFADHHLVVATGSETSVSRSDVTVVEGAARVGELARMLAGRDTKAARVHAAELIRDALIDKAAHARR
jgi:DNA repair protein RecN (Recombination protein N)